MSTAYPLAWPNGWKRTPRHLRAPATFRTVKLGNPEAGGKPVTVPIARERLAMQLDALRAGDPILSTNLPLRVDGQPRAGQPEPDDTGAACYFNLGTRPLVLACDRWNTVAGNIAAIAAHIGAMRSMDRWGVGTVEQLFAGFAALPAAGPGQRPWRDVLNLPGRATIEDVKQRHLALMKVWHPDVEGGSTEKMATLNVARDQALAEIGA